MGQQVLNGIFLGSIYALFAVGYTLVFGILDILNLAHSAVFMLGAAVTFTLVVNHGQSFWLACAIAIVVAALMGLVIEYVCLRPLRRRRAPPIAALISTIGLALIISSALGGLAGILFGVALGDISPYIGRDSVEVRGLAVIVLGGMGSIPGAVLGGYLLGLIEVLAVVLLGSNVRAGVAFAALFLMLVLRPQGLFGAQLKERI